MPTSDFLVAGRRIRLESDRGGEPYAALTRDWSACAASAVGEPDAVIVIHERRWDEPSPLKLPPDARLLRMGGRKVFARGECLFIDFHESAFFRIEATRAEGVCYTYPKFDPLFWTELSVNHVLVVLMRRLRRFFLHAGGAVAPDGTAVLFTGAGGSGKSTCSLRLAAEGWPFLGDDTVFFDDEGVFHPFPKEASASAWSVETLGVGSWVRGARQGGKLLLSPPLLAGASNRFRLLHPIPSARGINGFRSCRPDEARTMIASQVRACDSDRLTGDPLPDIERFSSRLEEIRVGNLATLPRDLLAQG